MSTPTQAVRHTTTTAVVAVAGIAAVVSYAHMQQLADHAGEAWRSWLIPLSIDGLVVAASMVLLTRRRAGLPGGALAWGALVTGVLASLAANMADARHEITAVLVAGWPALAFAVVFELLLQQRRAQMSTTRTELVVLTEPTSPVRPTPAAPTLIPPSGVVGGYQRTTSAPVPGPLLDLSAPHPGALLDTGSAPRGGLTSQSSDLASPVPSPATPGPAPAVTSPPPVARQPSPAPAASLVDRVRPLVAGGHGRTEIARRLGITPHQARQAIATVNAERTPLRAVKTGGAR